MTEHEWLTCTDPQRMLRCLEQWHRDGNSPWSQPTFERKLRLFVCACCRQVWDRLTDDVLCPRCKGAGGWRDAGDIHADLARWIDCTDCHGTGRINRSRKAVEVAERFADGKATRDELDLAFTQADDLVMEAGSLESLVAISCHHNTGYAAPLITRSEMYQYVKPETQAAILREIFGNPFVPVVILDGGGQTYLPWASPISQQEAIFDTAWRTPDVLAVAQGICTERRFQDMPILRDALMDAGCTDEAILNHCRGLEWCLACGGDGKYEADNVGPNAHGRYSTMTCRVCNGSGWIPLRGPHVRGCWVLDLILGKE